MRELMGWAVMGLFFGDRIGIAVSAFLLRETRRAFSPRLRQVEKENRTMRRKVNVFMVIGLGLGAVVPAADESSLEQGLIAWWRMELKVGNIISDASGNCHDLTVNGSPTFEDGGRSSLWCNLRCTSTERS